MKSYNLGKLKALLLFSGLIMFSVISLKLAILLGYIKYCTQIGIFNYSCFLVLSILFYVMAKEFFYKKKEELDLAKYLKKLNDVLISQSHNELFYTGNVSTGAMVLTKEVVNVLGADRTSIWLYSNEDSAIICQQLYVKAENEFYQDLELFEKDFAQYFEALRQDPIIVAHNAETHPATVCFLEPYLKPLGIKSMLDVPIWYRGKVIGVICVETLTPRIWKKEEVDFAQILSSLYSFAYSIKEGNSLTQSLSEMEQFIDAAALISKADAEGKITYVNDKFTKVSGFTLAEVLGKDHNIVNSGVHPKSFWKTMYKTTIEEKKIWNRVVTNRAKNGHLYYVDTFIKAEFDKDTDELLGFTSIRQDVTDIVESLNEIDKKNTYLEHAAKILRHDMHSGINTYMPRGVSSLERRLTADAIRDLKLEAPLKMIKEGLKHTQKVYRGVYEFTNLVKQDVVLTKTECKVKDMLEDYLSSTAYKSQVLLDDNLPTLEVNESLFCTAIDNLIRNGLKYNDSSTKLVKIYFEKSRKRFGLAKHYIIVEDNGRGIDQKDFEKLSRPYVRKEGQKEAGSGLGLNICKAILQEHGFEITAEKLEQGTKLKIKIK
jgi:PAS domain S-box-containing protein